MYSEGNGKSLQDFKEEVVIETDLCIQDCSWSYVEDRFGEGGSVGGRVIMVPK